MKWNLGRYCFDALKILGNVSIYKVKTLLMIIIIPTISPIIGHMIKKEKIPLNEAGVIFFFCLVTYK